MTYRIREKIREDLTQAHTIAAHRHRGIDPQVEAYAGILGDRPHGLGYLPSKLVEAYQVGRQLRLGGIEASSVEDRVEEFCHSADVPLDEDGVTLDIRRFYGLG